MITNSVNSENWTTDIKGWLKGNYKKNLCQKSTIQLTFPEKMMAPRLEMKRLLSTVWETNQDTWNITRNSTKNSLTGYLPFGQFLYSCNGCKTCRGQWSNAPEMLCMLFLYLKIANVCDFKSLVMDRHLSAKNDIGGMANFGRFRTSPVLSRSSPKNH